MDPAAEGLAGTPGVPGLGAAWLEMARITEGPNEGCAACGECCGGAPCGTAE